MEFTGIVLAFGVLLLLGLCWFGFYYWANPPMKDADAVSKITGNCGDTMELALQFGGDKVVQTRHWTDGCSVSNQCIEAAAMLSRGKNVTELKNINMMDIMEITGQLPESHLHCAQLAETVLQKAVHNYIQGIGART